MCVDDVGQIFILTQLFGIIRLREQFGANYLSILCMNLNLAHLSVHIIPRLKLSYLEVGWRVPSGG